MTNLSGFLAKSAAKYPHARALVYDDAATSYSALNNDVARFADYLADNGLRPGDRVGVMLPNGPDFVVAFYGVMHAGGVVLPLNPALRARAAEFYLTINDARMLFVTPRHAIASSAAAVTAGTQPVDIGDHGTAQLTAGFAGRNGPVCRAARDVAVVLPIAKSDGAHTLALTHEELANSQASIADLLLPLGQDDIVMGCLPMSERAGMTFGLLAAMSCASTLVMTSVDPALDPATALETVAGERVTVLEGQPAMYVALLEAAQHYDEDFSSLRVCVSAGGPLPIDVSHRLRDRFGCVVVDADESLVARRPV